mmetsp:Transcript_37952/g.64626  ORF Transcript_37952/g.64626 Transcript_37952/m.64626 type:complete len:313 (+) Transcript_37952:108-1046(+)
MACAFLSACATSMELALLCSTLVTGMGSHPRPRARDKRSVGASKSILSCRIAASPPPSMPFRGSSRSGAQGTSSNRSLRRKHPHHSFSHESAKARPACAEARSALTAPACVVSNPLHAPAAAPGGLPGLLVIAAVAALALAARLCLAVRMASAERFGGRRLRNRTNRRSGCRAAAAAAVGNRWRQCKRSASSGGRDHEQRWGKEEKRMGEGGHARQHRCELSHWRRISRTGKEAQRSGRQRRGPESAPVLPSVRDEVVPRQAGLGGLHPFRVLRRHAGLPRCVLCAEGKALPVARRDFQLWPMRRQHLASTS